MFVRATAFLRRRTASPAPDSIAEAAYSVSPASKVLGEL